MANPLISNLVLQLDIKGAPDALHRGDVGKLDVAFSNSFKKNAGNYSPQALRRVDGSLW